jgi:hypothetical protein
MTIADDRFIFDGLTRGQAILFLVRCGYDEKKLEYDGKFLFLDDIVPLDVPLRDLRRGQ